MRFLLLAIIAALCVGISGAGSSQAVPMPSCVVIDDSGHCAPPGAYDPGPVVSSDNGATWDAADGRHCYQTGQNGDRWYRGSLTYGRGLTIRAQWCANPGQSALVSFAYQPEFPHQTSCSPSNFASSIVSGGIGYSWVTRHYEVNYHCQTIWPFGFSDRVWFNVRYGTYGAHYFVDWNGK
jgi:hypothetical protein